MGSLVQDDSESSCESAEDVVSSTGSNLLTPGISWAISLTTRGTVREELLRVCFLSKNSDGTDDENLLYRFDLTASPHSRIALTQQLECSFLLSLNSFVGLLVFFQQVIVARKRDEPVLV